PFLDSILSFCKQICCAGGKRASIAYVRCLLGESLNAATPEDSLKAFHEGSELVRQNLYGYGQTEHLAECFSLTIFLFHVFCLLKLRQSFPTCDHSYFFKLYNLLESMEARLE